MHITPKMEELTQQVLKDIETKGTMPWQEPWFYAGLRNWDSGRGYRGINTISLSLFMTANKLEHGQFLTYRQAEKCGGKVKKGSHGVAVWFFKPTKTKDKDGEEKTVPIMRTYIVFGIDQIDGLTPKPSKERPLSPNAMGEQIIAKCGAVIKENQAAQCHPAFYSTSADTVSVPKRNLWKTDEGFYSTVFHELVHWTSKKDRCDRDLSKYHFDNKERAFEELVAELGAAFLSAFVGFKYETQHTAYVSSWISVLKDHKDALYLAASKAQKAVDYILEQAGLQEKRQNAQPTAEPIAA